MIFFPEPAFFLFFVLFWPAVFLAFFVPGNLWIRKLSLPFFEELALSFSLGIVLWATAAFLLGFLGQKWLLIPYLIGAFLVWLAKKKALPSLKIDPIVLGIVVIGVFLQVSAVWFIGTKMPDGLFFCCRGVPDDIYHLALVDQLVRNFPPFEPGMAGVVVHNYHYLSHLVIAQFIQTFHFPLVPTTYQFFPVLISLLLAFSTISFAKILQMGKNFTRWLVFFVFFHGDILYLFFLLRGKGINFDVTIFDDATKLLAGIPRAFSITLLFAGLSLFVVWIKKRNILSGLAAMTVLGSLAGFKIYTGIFALAGLFFVALFFLGKRDWKMAFLPLVAVFVALLFYLPVNTVSVGMAFNGLYRSHDFVSQPSFGLTNLELARKQFFLTGDNVKGILLEIVFLAFYFISLYGTTLVALCQKFSWLKKLPLELNIFLISASVVTGIVGFFFVQGIGGLNSVQFLLALYFIGAIYAALSVSSFLASVSPRLKMFLVVGLVLFTASRAIYEGVGNFQQLSTGHGTWVMNQELAAMDYLRTQTPADSVILLPPEKALKETSLTAGFLSQRRLFLSGVVGVLSDHQVPGFLDREKINGEVFEKTDTKKVRKILRDAGIDYVVLDNFRVIPADSF